MIQFFPQTWKVCQTNLFGAGPTGRPEYCWTTRCCLSSPRTFNFIANDSDSCHRVADTANTSATLIPFVMSGAPRQTPVSTIHSRV
jgi:hypothetical protein